MMEIMFGTLSLRSPSYHRCSSCMSPLCISSPRVTFNLIRASSCLSHRIHHRRKFLKRSHWTVSSYMALITHTLSSLTFLSRSSPTGSGYESDYDMERLAELYYFRCISVAFALFDSLLDLLKLPVSKPPTIHHPFGHDTGQPTPRMEPVATFVERYFERTAVFSQGNPPSLALGITLLVHV